MANHNDAAEFVGVLLHSSTAAHFLHLQTASYAAHKALGHYYENIVDLADKYAEAYQGHYGIIPLDQYPEGFKVQKDAAAYAESLLTFVKGIRQMPAPDCRHCVAVFLATKAPPPSRNRPRPSHDPRSTCPSGRLSHQPRKPLHWAR